MIAWLWNIIVGQFCCHKWQEDKFIKRVNSRGDLPEYFECVLKCAVCGNIKVKRI